MNRRHFLSNCAAVTALSGSKLLWGASALDGGLSRNAGLDGSMAGKPVDLAACGEIQSWISPEATPQLEAASITSRAAGSLLNLATMPWKQSEFDVGVEWPEFRTVERVVVQFASDGKVPNLGKTFLEYWKGITSRQGSWEAVQESPVQGADLEKDGRTWTFRFAPRRTCKVRLRFQAQEHVEIERLAVYGQSVWRSGEIRIEWGHRGPETAYDGKLERYNGEVLDIKPLGNTQLGDGFSWTSTAGAGTISGIVARVLYAWGEPQDRSILTLRTKACQVSFLPAEAIEQQPIDIPDFGIYIRKASLALDRESYRRQSQGRKRVMDAVAGHPEQTLENAYQHIRARRVPLSFVGVDSNNHKFGIAPDGHLVAGYNDPRRGHPMRPKFSVYFAATGQNTLFEKPENELSGLFTSERPKQQSLEEGWLPIIRSTWSENQLAFERTDYAVLQHSGGSIDESQLSGVEPVLLISRLTIRNNSTLPNAACYYIKPWKPANGRMSFGALPANPANAWEPELKESSVAIIEDGAEHLICYVDTHGSGSLSLVSGAGAARYSLLLDPGEEHTLHTVIPGEPLPCLSGIAALQGLDYEKLLASTKQYWKDLLAKGMQVQIPDEHLQNVYNASLHHFLLALTKDQKRGESYPNVAMFYYGSIGSESSPVTQALEMRGLHSRAEKCLRAWLSTQGDSAPAGDYASKEGGFYHFWPNYTIDQGAVLWTLAEHYLYTSDKEWLRKAAPQIVAGCEFIIRERKRTMKLLPGGRKPLSYGLAPAGCVADPGDWEYSFMLNGYFYLGLKKSAHVLKEVDPANARRIADEAAAYLQAIHKALKESVILSPVMRLRDNTSVPVVPPYLGLRGLSSEVQDSLDPDPRHGYAYDVTIGPFHILKTEVVEPHSPEVTAMLNSFEDHFFLYTPLPSRVDLDDLATDWFNLGGFAKLQPYYVHYQDAYLERDQIPNFLRGFFNTLAAISDPQTLTFMEELDGSGGQPNKTHEEGWFFHQFRGMLVMETGNDLYLARGTPRRWLDENKRIVVRKAPSYFGELSYRIESHAGQGRIEATVNPPSRNQPANLYLRLRHPAHSPIKRVTINGREWKRFDVAKEWINLPRAGGELKVVAYY
ncbi:MAG TPA: hypothetical protein VMW54_12795 [Terriglobia bacterium]|nr:hypothetical protein [Terriglobia bacterium]